MIVSVTTKLQSASFPRICRTYGLSIKRDWYQVIVSVTTKPQSSTYLRISRTYGLSIKQDWYQVIVSVITKPQSASFSRISRTYGLSIPKALLFPDLAEPIGLSIKRDCTQSRAIPKSA